MKSTKTLSNGQEVWTTTVTGEVLSSDKSSTVRVHQSVATVLSDKLVIPGVVQSQTTTTHEVWLRTADGERQVNLGRVGLAVRPGHVVTVAYGGSHVLSQGPLIGACNHTTGELVCDVARTVDDGLKAWKLDVGATGSFWRWTVSGTVLAALVGGAWGRATAYAHSVPQDTLAGALGLGIAGFVLTALFWLFVGMHFLLNGKATALLAEVNDFARERLLAAVPLARGVHKTPAASEPTRSSESAAVTL